MPLRPDIEAARKRTVGLHCNDHTGIWVQKNVGSNAAAHRDRKPIHQISSNDEVERRGIAPTTTLADLSPSSTYSLAQRRRGPAIARTDC